MAENMYEYRVRATSGIGPSDWSNVARFQWQSVIVQRPTAPTQFSMTGSTTTSRSFSWSETADPTVDKHGLMVGGVLTVDGIDKTARTYTWPNLQPGQSYSNVGIARHNSAGWSPVSNTVSFTQPTDPVDPGDPPTATTMLMGCSSSPNSHGGTEVWDGWRCYTTGTRDSLANRTGNQRPKFLAYSDGDLGGTSPNYSTVRQQVIDNLNQFYYGGTGSTRSARWGIKLFYSCGNENYDSGSITLPHTQAKIDNHVTIMRALYDGCHYVDPATGQRRFPDAFAGSNPTQNQEQQGIVADALHPSARYHDFVMWSMYPPGRKTTVSDPTYNWPSFREADRTDGQLGFLIRCFYRTAQARAQARIDRNDPSFNLMIGCGEVGIGDDPGDSTTRPYYTVHGLAGGMQKLSTQYNLPMPFACWWDNEVTANCPPGGCPQNILSDEPSGTNPSTRVAWQTWKSLNHEFGGTHPSTWSGNPKSGWKTTGPVV